jgi:hypothetical protein
MSRGPKPYYAREPRSDIRIPARLFFDGVQREAQLVNVSLSGGFLVASEPPGAQQVIALAVVPPVGEPIYFHATVIRVEETSERVGCAVKFLNLSPESEGRLAYLIKRTAVPRPQK